MRFAVEAWSPDYGVAADPAQFEPADMTVDVGIEAAPDDWEALTPSADLVLDRILFVDGVRRIDARIWFDDGDNTRVGVCASVAAGTVTCTPTTATVDHVKVERGFFAPASPAAQPIVTRHGTYQYCPTAGDTPEDLYLAIHKQMTATEVAVAQVHDADLVVYDGPLRGRHDPLAVGYIKTQHVQYLPDQQQRLLRVLGDGQRTPIFLIGGSGFTRYSWYQRLPGPRTQPLAGIIRCETAAIGAVPNAITRANIIAATLPRYASQPHKDARAPQNLYPIAGLENHLRHRLGDQQVLDRALRRVATPRPLTLSASEGPTT